MMRHWCRAGRPPNMWWHREITHLTVEYFLSVYDNRRWEVLWADDQMRRIAGFGSSVEDAQQTADVTLDRIMTGVVMATGISPHLQRMIADASDAVRIAWRYSTGDDPHPREVLQAMLNRAETVKESWLKIGLSRRHMREEWADVEVLRVLVQCAGDDS